MQDPWWNPAVEEQAIMRVHRIGQTKNVTIRRFIVKVSLRVASLTPSPPFVNLVFLFFSRGKLALRFVEGFERQRDDARNLVIGVGKWRKEVA
jgi:hypothetical protein